MYSYRTRLPLDLSNLMRVQSQQQQHHHILPLEETPRRYPYRPALIDSAKPGSFCSVSRILRCGHGLGYLYVMYCMLPKSNQFRTKSWCDFSLRPWVSCFEAEAIWHAYC